MAFIVKIFEQQVASKAFSEIKRNYPDSYIEVDNTTLLVLSASPVIRVRITKYIATLYNSSKLIKPRYFVAEINLRTIQGVLGKADAQKIKAFAAEELV